VSARVVCVGLATLDSIFALPRHPGADDRVVATELAVAGGGPAATAAVALVQDQPLADALAFANRAAALSYRALDGRSAIPTFEEVA
jgi:sugar/nucleoside kinase (ribokinase family)